MRLALTGASAGLAIGYVLQRGQLCFHATFAGLYERRLGLFRAWALGVALAAAGLTLVYGLGPWDDLNRGLSLRPVPNLVGGLLIGVGMHIAMSCASGLFYKLGAGMLGCLVGLVGWALGELAARDVRLPGREPVLRGEDGTLPGWLGAPRWLLALPLAVVVVVVLVRTSRGERGPGRAWQWGWVPTGVVLGLATTAAWALAGAGGASFGPSTVGAVTSLADGDPHWWLIAFLLAVVAGSSVAARTAGGWWVRGEAPVRYVQLAAGGFLLGAGGRIGGGCNLGHGLSGMAQLNLSSMVAVGGIVAGIGLARTLRHVVTRRVPVPAELA
ncbi:MAG: YeeE/YedE family protein [Acidimicrobiia bacterium]|nr:YeeE/YedE family protein [Acidimicrobiia bacterium]